MNKNNQYLNILRDWNITILLGLLILTLGLVLRLYNLTHLPVFGDEAIYIRWSQIMSNESTLRFIPLTDGKQPLFMWVMMPFLKIFSDPLFAGRFVSVAAGITTGIGIFVLSFLFFKSKIVSLVSMFIYMVVPFGFFFDRLAMADSMLSSFGIWSVIFSYLLVKYRRLDLSMILGFILAGALLTKSPSLFYSLLIPLNLIFLFTDRKEKIGIKNIITLFLLIGISYLIAYSFYNFIIRLGPNSHMIALRNRDYVFPISHFWENPKDPFIFHFHRSLEWFVIYGSWWLIGLVLLGFTNIRKHFWQHLVIFSLLFIPIIIQSMFAKVFTTRYIFFTFPYFAILAGLSFSDIKFKTLLSKAIIILLILFFIQSFFFYKTFFTDLENTPLARTDRSGFLEEWTSGTGIKESAEIIKNIKKDLSQDSQIVVGTEGYFGTLPDGLQMYLANTPNITVIGVGIDLKDIPIQLVESKNAGNRTFLLINSSRLKMDVNDPRFKIIASYPKAKRP